MFINIQPTLGDQWWHVRATGLEVIALGVEKTFTSSTMKVTLRPFRDTADTIRISTRIHWEWSIESELMRMLNGHCCSFADAGLGKHR